MKKALMCFAILLGAGAFLCGCNKELTPEEIQMRSLMGEEIWTPEDISKEVDETKKECTVIIPKGFYRSTELYLFRCQFLIAATKKSSCPQQYCKTH